MARTRQSRRPVLARARPGTGEAQVGPGRRRAQPSHRESVAFGHSWICVLQIRAGFVETLQNKEASPCPNWSLWQTLPDAIRKQKFIMNGIPIISWVSMCVQAPLIIFLQIKIKQSTSALESHRPLLLFTYQHVAPSHRLTAVPGSGASPQLSLCWCQCPPVFFLSRGAPLFSLCCLLLSPAPGPEPKSRPKCLPTLLCGNVSTIWTN